MVAQWVNLRWVTKRADIAAGFVTAKPFQTKIRYFIRDVRQFRWCFSMVGLLLHLPVWSDINAGHVRTRW